MTILITCNGKFCYGRRKFQNAEAATGSVLKNFTKFTGNYLCQSLIFNKGAGFRVATLLCYTKKKKTSTFFSVKFVNFFKKTLFANGFFSKYDCLQLIVAGHS